MKAVNTLFKIIFIFAFSNHRGVFMKSLAVNFFIMSVTIVAER